MLRMETIKRSGLWSSLNAHGSLVIIWWLCISGSGETRHFYFISSLIWPWRSKSIALQNYRDLNQWILHFWSKFGDLSLNGWWVMVRTSSKWGKFGIWPNIWPWRSRSIAPQNNRDINQVVLHLLSKFDDLSLNASRVIVRTNRWLTETHTHTQMQVTTIHEGQNSPRVKTHGGEKVNYAVTEEMGVGLGLMTVCVFRDDTNSDYLDSSKPN